MTDLDHEANVGPWRALARRGIVVREWRVRDGDLIRVDAVTGQIDCLEDGFADRDAVTADLSKNGHGVGRELFAAFRANVGLAETGAGVVV